MATRAGMYMSRKRVKEPRVRDGDAPMNDEGRIERTRELGEQAIAKICIFTSGHLKTTDRAQKQGVNR